MQRRYLTCNGRKHPIIFRRFFFFLLLLLFSSGIFRSSETLWFWHKIDVTPIKVYFDSVYKLREFDWPFSFYRPGLGPGGLGGDTARRLSPRSQCVISAGHGGKGGVRSDSIRDYAGQVYGREDSHTLGGSGGKNSVELAERNNGLEQMYHT